MNALLTEKPPCGALSIKQILVAVGLSPHSDSTARYAAEIAKHFGASIVLTHVCPICQADKCVTAWAAQEIERQRREAQAALTSLTQTLRRDYERCEEKLLMGEPADEIALAARDLKADLIVTASHHPGFLGRLFNLDQAPQILHRAPCSVLVCHGPESWARKLACPVEKQNEFEEKDGRRSYHGLPPGATSPKQTQLMRALIQPGFHPAARPADEGDAQRKRILAPVDLTGDAGPTLDFATGWARECDADLYVLHVYSAADYSTGAHPIYAVQGIDWCRRHRETKLLEWVDRLQEQYPRTFALFEDGDCAARRIQEIAARLQADLIVISTHDRAWLAKFVCYCDADELVRKATTPVLVFRAKQ